MNSHRRKRMQQVRKRLASLPADRSGHAVFIVRSTFGQNIRVLENEAALAAFLAKRGFTIVNPMQDSAQDIIR
jgi:capsular polysaccharide biosynthesis protein